MTAAMIANARAEALFASRRQPSETLTAAEVTAAVAETVRLLRLVGCACCVAAEFGDHPDTAVARMLWARSVVATTWPGRTR